MEATGLVIGIVGLAGIFKIALEAWEFVDSARGQAESFEFLRTRLDNQRVIFLIWAGRMGFGTPEGYGKSLDRPPLRARQIESTLRQIATLFSNTDELIRLYGLKIHSVEAQIDGGDAPAAIFRSQYDRVRAIIRNKRQLSILSEPLSQQQSTSLWKKAQWSIRDEKKTQSLVAKIGELVADLEGLTQDIQAAKTREQYATEVVADISETALRAIKNSCRTGEDVISSAASIRLSSLRQAQTLASASISSASFFTAKSHSLSQMEPKADKSGRWGTDTQFVDFSTIKKAHDKICVDLAAKAQPEWFPDSTPNNSGRHLSRLYNEINTIASEPHGNDWYTICPIDDHLDRFLSTFCGPAGTPYEGGIFHIRINIGAGYPFKSPQAWFLTKILHPNVDKNGAICIDIFGEGWTPTYTMSTLTVGIASILNEPGWDNPIEGAMPEEFTVDRELFNLRAREWTRRFAVGSIINPGERNDGFYNVTESVL
ncbi:Ff.00g112900.m01.CDS01 [Fusarium sp. VM40]|nr:Ff.00g112900.m01.CDS01 [Fusarium sp. VM40]